MTSALNVVPGAANPDGLRSFGASSARDALDVSAFAAGLARPGRRSRHALLGSRECVE